MLIGFLKLLKYCKWWQLIQCFGDKRVVHQTASRSKVHHRRMCVFSYTLLFHFSLLWPWPWPDDLDVRTWPRYSADVSAQQKWSFYVKAFKRAQSGQTDTQTDATENITIVALASDKIYGHHRHAKLHLHITFQLWFFRSWWTIKWRGTVLSVTQPQTQLTQFDASRSSVAEKEKWTFSWEV